MFQTLPRPLAPILIGLTLTVAAATSHAGESSAEAAASVAPAVPENHTALARLEELDLLSQGLVEKAGSGSARAHDFRIEARVYREQLRQVMLSDREQPPTQQLPQDLLLAMVRMSALLHAAADCKTGQVIVCPADLLLQLKSQQATVTQALAVAKQTAN